MNGNNPLAGVTADVTAILGYEDRKENRATLPRWKRNQVRRDTQRVKITIDLTEYPWLEQEIRALARREQAGVSSAAAYLLALGLRNYVKPQTRPSQSRQHDYDLVVQR